MAHFSILYTLIKSHLYYLDINVDTMYVFLFQCLRDIKQTNKWKTHTHKTSIVRLHNKNHTEKPALLLNLLSVHISSK